MIVIFGFMIQVAGAAFVFSGFPEITVINYKDTNWLAGFCTNLDHKMALYDFKSMDVQL